MTDVIEIDAATGQITERQYTPAEAEQRQIDAESKAATEAAAAAKAAADAAATAAAIAHAKSLGFTDEMISVMYPNLGAGNE
jgi:hypothetical protein